MHAPRRSLLDYLWASPGTFVGFALGALALPFGARWSRRQGVVEVALRPAVTRAAPRLLPISAITFGHVVLGRSAAELERLRAHEHAHVAQYERWGALFLLAYPLASALQLLRGRRPYHDNAFEAEAREVAVTSRPVPVSGLATPLRFAALVAIALVAVAALMIADFGLTAKALGPPLAVTARMALVLFAAAFATAALPGWRQRHQALALAFVACHLVHLALIFARASLAARPQMLADPVGIAAYAGVLVIALHALAGARGAAWPRPAQLLAASAWWCVWAVFAATYAEPWIRDGETPAVGGMALLGALVLAAVVRLAGARFVRRETPP